MPAGRGGNSGNNSAGVGSRALRASRAGPGVTGAACHPAANWCRPGSCTGSRAWRTAGQDLGIDPAAVFKAHLGLGRVDVDIHLFGRGRKMHDKDRVPPPGQQPLVSLAHGPGHELVADDAAVDQEELILGGGNVVVRAGNQTRDPKAVARQIQGQHLFGPLRPQEDRQPFPEAGVGGGLEQGLVLGLDQKVDFGVAQGQVAQQLQNLPLFRLHWLRRNLRRAGVL